MKNRAVIYCRVSSEEQVKNLSLGTQEKICREYCARNDWEVDQVFVEEGESAKTTNRTRFQEMLTYCRGKKGCLHFVVVYAVNRFARNEEDHFAVASFLRRLGIGLRSATEPIDESPAGKFVESMLAAVASLDNGLRRQNTINGMKSALSIGRWPFQAPLGYRKAKDQSDNPTLVPDVDRAPLIRKAFELYSTGLYKKDEVRKAVTDLGLRTLSGKKLSRSTFEQILNNPLYVGQLRVKEWGVQEQGRFEPLVSQELFDSAHAVLAGRKKSITSYQRNHPDFPLRNFATCESCGHVVTGSWSKGRTQKYPYYHCSKRCRGINVRKEIFEARFLDLLRSLQPTPEAMALFRHVVVDFWKSKQAESDLSVAARQRQLTNLEDRKQRLLDAYLDKAIEKPTYQQQQDRLEAELADARLALHGARHDGLDIETVVEFVQQIWTDPAKRWLEMSLDQRQRMQRVLLPQGIQLTEKGQIRTAATSVPFNVLQIFSAHETSVGSLVVASWNQILAWLRQVDQFRQSQNDLPAAA